MPAAVTPKYNYEDFREQIFDEATFDRPNPPKLRITGVGMEGCVDVLHAKLREAAAANDFTVMLSPIRDWEV